MTSLSSLLQVPPFVRIRAGQIYSNDTLLFSAPDLKGRDFTQAAYKQFDLQYPRFYKMDPMSQLGMLAAHLLLSENEFSSDPYTRGLLLQNRHASLDSDERYQHSLKELASPLLFVYTLPNIVMGEIAIRYSWKGENTCLVSETFDPAELLNYLSVLFQDNILESVLTGFLDYYNHEADVLLFLINKKSHALPSPERMLACYEAVRS